MTMCDTWSAPFKMKQIKSQLVQTAKNIWHFILCTTNINDTMFENKIKQKTNGQRIDCYTCVER